MKILGLFCIYFFILEDNPKKCVGVSQIILIKKYSNLLKPFNKIDIGTLCIEYLYVLIDYKDKK